MRQKESHHIRTKGFTLIELLVVIAIISLLATVVFAGLSAAESKGRDVKRTSDMQSIAAALELYYQDNNSYPVGSCISSPWWSCWGSAGEQRLLPATDIPTMPQDPSFSDIGDACDSGGTSRVYAYYSDGQSYILSTHLENPVPPSDPHYYNGTYGCTASGNWAIDNGF